MTTLIYTKCMHKGILFVQLKVFTTPWPSVSKIRQLQIPTMYVVGCHISKIKNLLNFENTKAKVIRLFTGFSLVILYKKFHINICKKGFSVHRILAFNTGAYRTYVRINLYGHPVYTAAQIPSTQQQSLIILHKQWILTSQRERGRDREREKEREREREIEIEIERDFNFFESSSGRFEPTTPV